MANINQKTLDNILNNTALLGENIERLKNSNIELRGKIESIRTTQEDILIRLDRVLTLLDSKLKNRV